MPSCAHTTGHPRLPCCPRYWTLGEEAPDTWQPDPNPLPSDLRYREDLVLLQRNDIKLGQQAKEMLEHRQRADVKLRKQGNSEG